MEKGDYKYVVLAALIIVVVFIYNRNQKNKIEDDETAEKGEYSDSGNYKNITPMKHDIMKQITLDLTPVMIPYIISLLLSDRVNMKNILSVEDYKSFSSSVVGSTLLALLGYGLYYQIFEPYIVNRVVKF